MASIICRQISMNCYVKHNSTKQNKKNGVNLETNENIENL